MRSLLTFASMSLLVACGGSDLDPGAGNDPGTGTSTLLVDGEIEARPRIVNAKAVDDFDTNITVQVSLNNALVTTGTVTLTTARGTTPLTFRTDKGEWHATVSGYDEVFVLDVQSGEHSVDGVRVDGPDLHAFTEPLAGATLDSTVATRIVWSSEQEASSASIDTDEIGRINVPDTGIYMLAAGALKAENDTPRENTIDLVRMNRVTPAGAVAGSNVSVSVENNIVVVAQANPAI